MVAMHRDEPQGETKGQDHAAPDTSLEDGCTAVVFRRDIPPEERLELSRDAAWRPSEG
jgi:hypothetical protein